MLLAYDRNAAQRSWTELRGFLGGSARALGGSPLRRSAQALLASHSGQFVLDTRSANRQTRD